MLVFPWDFPASSNCFLKRVYMDRTEILSFLPRASTVLHATKLLSLLLLFFLTVMMLLLLLLLLSSAIILELKVTLGQAVKNVHVFF